MNRATLIPLLLILSLATLGYAIYRSTAVRITTISQNQETVYGDPHHGLLFGLCVFAGMCLLGMVYLIDRDRSLMDNRSDVVRREERTDLTRRTLS